MTDDLSPEECERYEREWRNIDQKTLLAQILGELGAIRQQLEQLNAQVGEPRTRQAEQSGVVVCNACRESVPENDRRKHAIDEHGAPESIAVEDLPMFT